jgi:hypothetical protein
MLRRSKTKHSFSFIQLLLLLLQEKYSFAASGRWVKHSLWKKHEHFVSFNFSILNSMQLLAFIKMCALYLCILCMSILLPAHKIEIGSFQNSANTHHGEMRQLPNCIVFKTTLVLCVSHWFRVPLSQLFSMILMFL